VQIYIHVDMMVETSWLFVFVWCGFRNSSSCIAVMHRMLDVVTGNAIGHGW